MRPLSVYVFNAFLIVSDTAGFWCFLGIKFIKLARIEINSKSENDGGVSSWGSGVEGMGSFGRGSGTLS